MCVKTVKFVAVQSVDGGRLNEPLEARFRSVKNRSGTKFESSRTALSLSAGVFQGPQRVPLASPVRALNCYKKLREI